MFSYNGKFAQTVNQILDCLYLSFLWIVASLPIITIGAATTALYSSVDKVFRKEEGGIWKEYWRVFRRDFKRATGLWLIMVLIILILGANFYAAFTAGVSGEALQIALQVGTVFLMALMAIWLQFWFPYLSRFDDSVKTILKNTMAMMVAETKSSISLLLLFAFAVVIDLVISKYAPVLSLAMPVAYTIALNRILERLFARYIAQQNCSGQENSEEMIQT